jgi:hypothetical protein
MDYRQIKSLKKMVEEGLRECEDCRNSDIKLTNWIWVNFYPDVLTKTSLGDYAVRLLDLYDLPREDNVKRIRAVFQNEKNMYLPTDEKVRKQRKINEEQWRLFLGFNPEGRTP